MTIDLFDSIPNGWEPATLESICLRVTSGGTPSRLRPEFFLNGTWPWVKTQELLDRWILETEERITDEAVSNSSAKVLPANTVLLAMYGATVGQLGILARPMTCNQACCALMVDEQKADFRFVYYLLLAARSRIRAQSTGAAQQNLSGSQIKQFRFAFPDREMQRAIAGVLGSIDDKIELNERTGKTLAAMAQVAFKSWFLDQEHAWTVNDWQTLPLDAVADFLNGLALQKYPAEGGEDSLPVIKIAQLRSGHTRSADRAGTNVPAEYVINDGELLFSWSGSLEVDFWCGGRGALNQHLFKVTSTTAPLWYVYLWTKHHLPEFRAIAANKATTMGHIQRKHLREAAVLLPPPSVLKQMDNVIRPLISQMIQLRLEARSLTDLRDELLQKLLSGELIVGDATVTA